MQRISTLTALIVMATAVAFLPQRAAAQKVRTGNGTAQVRIEDNMTRTEARQKAEELAKINAISNEFGTYVEQQAEMTVQSGLSEFSVIGNTRVKGEWVRTISIQFQEDSRQETGRDGVRSITWVTCNIRGTMRQAVPKAQVEYSLLNCPEKHCQTTTFINNQRFYLRFRSPADGYLTIFMDNDQEVSRLLPYRESAASSVKIRADREYLFFGEEAEPETGVTVDKLVLFTDKPRENQKVYILFSEKEFIKPPLVSARRLPANHYHPAGISKPQFEKWLSENRALLPGFRDDQVMIGIVTE